MNNKWAVLIGIDGYHESLGSLNFCMNDAKLMQEILLSDYCEFTPDNVVLLTDDQPGDRLPTFGNIHSWLGTWLSRPGPDDLVLVYFAGHGQELHDQALLAPADATLESLPVTGISIQYIRGKLDSCRAAQKVLILDACHSGAGRNVAAMTSSFREALAAGQGLYTIASCDADQISYEWPEKQHGVFTYYFVEALRHGAAVGADGRISLDRAYEWTRNSILDWTAGKRLKQEPVRICRTKGDIYIASRAPDLEQQLKAANEQIRTDQQTIDKFRQDVALLTREKKNYLKMEQQLTVANERIRADQQTIDKFRQDVALLTREKKNYLKKIKEETMHCRDKGKARARRTTVMEWKKWASSDHDDGGVIVGIVLGSLAAGVVCGVMAAGCMQFWGFSGAQGAGGIIGVICSLGLALLSWLPLRRVRQNQYRLYCLQECVKGGDYLGASAYAHSMGRLGVDLGTGSAAVDMLAELAEDNGDIEVAKAAYRCASRVWKSPYAKLALEKLLNKEKNAL